MINNIAPPTQRVATIDTLFRRADGTTVSAGGRDIYRGDFRQNGVMATFPMEFNNPSRDTRQWDFRVKWYAKGVLRHERTPIYKVF